MEEKRSIWVSNNNGRRVQSREGQVTYKKPIDAGKESLSTYQLLSGTNRYVPRTRPNHISTNYYYKVDDKLDDTGLLRYV